jgi:hypothetical protein
VRVNIIPEEVCHYTKAKTALKILSTKKLRIGQFKFTNDPRESKERNAVIGWVAPTSFSTDPNHDEIISRVRKEADRIAWEEWKVLCFTLHRPQKTVRHPVDEVYNHSVRHGYSRPRMWAQYAENHIGVCLIFDANKLNKNIHEQLGPRCRIYQGRVSYIYRPLISDPIMLKNIQGDITKEILVEELRSYYFASYKGKFLAKHPDWRDETEYRWLLHSPENANIYVSIENAIKAVLVGVNFPKTSEPRLIKYCKELRVSVGKMEWDDGIALARFDSIYKP